MGSDHLTSIRNTHTVPHEGPGTTALVTGQRALSAPLAQQLGVEQIREILRQTRGMVRRVESASDAVLLVRRANAADKLLDDVLRSCRMLEEEQFELRQDAAEAHLRTQRKAGELLAQTILHAGGRPRKADDSQKEIAPPSVTLKELGITANESHRWRKIASLPQDYFEDHIREFRARRRELTTSSVLVRAQRYSRDGESIPDGKQALLGEYEKYKRQVAQLIWIDTRELVPLISRERRTKELEDIARLRLWLDEFERDLSAEGPVRRR